MLLRVLFIIIAITVATVLMVFGIHCLDRHNTTQHVTATMWQPELKAVGCPTGQWFKDGKCQKIPEGASNQNNNAVYKGGKWVKDKPADKPAAKPADKPAAKPADKPAAKPADKPAAKPANTNSNYKKPREGGVSNLAWSDDQSAQHTKDSANNVMLNTALDSPSAAKKKVQAEKDKGKYTVGYLNVGRVAKGEHAQMQDELNTALKKIGSSLDKVTKSSSDKWDERWLRPEALDDPRVMAIYTKAVGNELKRMKDQGYDAVGLDNVDFYQADNQGRSGENHPKDEKLATEFGNKVADMGHDAGLAMGWKNAPEIASKVEPNYDFIVAEQNYDNPKDKWAVDQQKSFTDNNKPAWNFQVDQSQSYEGKVDPGWVNYNAGGSSGWQN